MADLNMVLAQYKNGVPLNELINKYNLNKTEIEKLKKLTAEIQKELGAVDFSSSVKKILNIDAKNIKTLKLDDGTEVIAAKISTVKQPKGGFVNKFYSKDGQYYYQYTDANGKQQKVTKYWNYAQATNDNIEVAWNKLKDGHPIDALITLLSGAEDPRNLNTGVAPGAGFAKGAGGFLKSMKDFGSWLKKLKNVRSFEQFKGFAMSFIQKIKPAKQMKPSKNLPDGIDADVYVSLGKRNIVAQAYRFGNAAERHQGILNAQNIAKIESNLSKILGKKINKKDLKVVSLSKGLKYEFEISYYDSASGKAYTFLRDGTPNGIIEFEYGLTGKIKSYKYTGAWLDNKWEPF